MSIKKDNQAQIPSHKISTEQPLVKKTRDQRADETAEMIIQGLNRATLRKEAERQKREAQDNPDSDQNQ